MTRRLAGMIGFVILVVLVSLVLYNIFDTSSETSPSSQVKSVFSSEEMKDFDSEEHNFVIKFPGFPSIGKRSEKAGDRDISVSTYERIVEDNSKTYLVEVYDYTDLKLDEDKTLETDLNKTIQNTQGSKINTLHKTVYDGSKAIEADYTFIDKNNQTRQAYLRYIMKDSKMYVIGLTGADRPMFDEFANSLRFKNM